ncbi:MAG TPA: TonB-dependent receptor [Gemmatimonadales bacterium]|nr:TonB-dependent receptor [Gemmatimonadales bacterium]
MTITVTDPSGAAVSAALLTLVNAETGASWSATADNAGRAAFRGVAPGRYAVKAERAGFAPGRVDDVAIKGEEVTLQIQLKLQTLSEAVNVQGAPGTYVTATPPSGTKTDIPIRDMPQAIEVRTLQMLNDLGGTRSSYEVAKTVAGLFSAENGQGDPGRNVPNFFFRGFGNAGVYLKDGHAVNGWMSTFDTANTERVEFLKGPSSVLYGGTTYGGNIGGVVNYVSKTPSPTRIDAVDFTAGSQDFYRATFDLGGALNATKSVQFRVNGAAESGGSFRDFANHDSFFGAPALALRLSSNDTLTLLTDFQHSHEVPARGLPISAESFDISRSTNFIDPTFSRTDVDALSLLARFNHTFGQRWAVTADAAYTRSRTDQYLTSLTYVAGGGSTSDLSQWSFAEDQPTLDLRGTGRFRTGTVSHDVLLGYNLTRNHYTATSRFGFGGPSLPIEGTTLDGLVLPPNGSAQALYDATAPDPGVFDWHPNANAFYAQDLVGVAPWLKLLLSARHDRFSEEVVAHGSFSEFAQTTRNSHTSPRFGVVVQPASVLSLYAAWAQSFTPNTGITLDNQAPPPELGTLGEAGIKLAFGGKVSLVSSYFNLTRKNMSFSDPTDPNGLAVLVAGETRTRGWELDLNGEVIQGLRLNVAGTILKGSITEGEPSGSLVVGQEFGGVPNKTLNVFGVYTFGSGHEWEVGGGFYYAGDTWADDANTLRVPALLQVDALVSYRIGKRAHVQVNAKNLANRHNYTSNGWGWVNPAEPFSVYANVRYAF